jgi:hypothetical protein
MRSRLRALCVLLVLLWLPAYLLLGDVTVAQLIIDAGMAIVPFPLIALLPGGERRAQDALEPGAADEVRG